MIDDTLNYLMIYKFPKKFVHILEFLIEIANNLMICFTAVGKLF